MLPYKIVQDLNPASAPENSSNLNVNINFDILKQTLINEQGFDKLSTTGKQIIGSCILPDNSVCIFSVIQKVGYTESEIGILTDTTYKIVARDQYTIVELNFTTEHQIQAESKVNYNGDFIVYWVDGFNSDKWLNLTNPQIDINISLGIPVIENASQLQLMLSFTPKKGENIDNTATVISGGSLPAAVYYIVVTYGDKYRNFTKLLYVSNPIPVVKNSGLYNRYFIGNPAGELTGKAIQFTIDNTKLNGEYDFIKVNVIKKENQILTGYEFGVFSFSTTNDFTCIVDNLTNEVTVDSIIINLSDYKSSLTLTQLDDVLYKANLKSRSNFNFQPYINNITTSYIQKQIDLSEQTAGKNYKDPNLCFYSKSFMYDEVYALYASFIIDEDGFEYETDAYHIPGRTAESINLGGAFSCPENKLLTEIVSDALNRWVSNDYYAIGVTNNPINQMLAISNQARIFHCIDTYDKAPTVLVNGYPRTNMAYWENQNETYSNEAKWIVLNADGTQNTALPNDDFRGQKVRHHKFPGPYTEQIAVPDYPNPAENIHASNVNYNIVNVLGVKLSNIVIPTAYIGKVKKIKLYHAKRDYNNRTVLGQSLLETLNGLHVNDSSTTGTANKILNSVGNLLFAGMPSPGAGDPHRTGVYPLTYELNGTNGTAERPINTWYGKDHIQTGSPLRYNGPTDPFSGYMKMKPFDLLQQSLSPNSVSYIKNMYRIQGVYDAQLDASDLSRVANSFEANYIFDPTGLHTSVLATAPIYSGINRDLYTGGGASKYANQYRKVDNIEYLDLNTPPTSNADYTSSPYNFTMLPFNYLGEKSIWVETNTRLYPNFIATNPTGDIYSQINGDIGLVNYNTNPEWNTSITGGGDYNDGLTVSPYISNMCVFKLNIFNTFENQILCEMGVIDFGATYDFYGADTFINIYGERETMSLTAYTSNPNQGSSYITGIHNYICQSTSNINYRYKGDNNWETFYPKEGFNEISSLPFINEEWFGYNVDYSANNDVLQPTIAPNFITPTQSEFPNRVIRSGVDNPEILNDNYLTFQAGDYRDFGKIKGQIENITNQNNKLIIKTPNALYYTLGREVINTENAESYVGFGDIFAVKPKESVSSDSYGGGIGRFSDVVNQYGYMYADASNGIVYLSNGENIDEISKEGLQIFFRNELKFKLSKQLKDKYFSIFPVYSISSVSYLKDWYVTYNNEIWKSTTAFTSSGSTYPGNSIYWELVDFYTLTDNISDIQGIGIHATFDYKYRRYILYKKDYNFIESNTIFLSNIPAFSATNYNKIVYYNGILYKLVNSGTTNSVFLPRSNTGLKIDFADYFEDKSFTMAYYPESKAWVSLYSYYPDFIFNTIDKVYSNKDSNIFKHNSEIQNNFYYDSTIIESFVEPILNTPGGTKKFSSISFYTDVFVKTITTKALQYLDTFTSLFVRNTWQMSKLINLVNGSTSRNSERYFLTNEFRDFTRNNADPLMNTKYISEQNSSNLNLTKHWSIQKKFTDYFLIPRLNFKQSWKTVNISPGVIDFTVTTSPDTNVIESTSYNFNVGDTIRFIYASNTHLITITKILANNFYNFENKTLVAGDSWQINEFEVLDNKEIHIYDINAQSTKNIR